MSDPGASKIDLGPCPFCGKPAEYSTRLGESLWSHDTATWHEARCSDCDIGMDECDDADELERRWNTRGGNLLQFGKMKDGDA